MQAMSEKGKGLGDLFGLDGHTRLAQTEEEYQRLLRLQRFEREIIATVLHSPGPGRQLLEPMPAQPDQAGENSSGE
jgi:hypothetical protein